jgi:hypothetical protein
MRVAILLVYVFLFHQNSKKILIMVGSYYHPVAAHGKYLQKQIFLVSAWILFRESAVRITAGKLTTLHRHFTLNSAPIDHT